MTLIASEPFALVSLRYQEGPGKDEALRSKNHALRTHLTSINGTNFSEERKAPQIEQLIGCLRRHLSHHKYLYY